MAGCKPRTGRPASFFSLSDGGDDEKANPALARPSVVRNSRRVVPLSMMVGFYCEAQMPPKKSCLHPAEEGGGVRGPGTGFKALYHHQQSMTMDEKAKLTRR